jgi:uncharacterized protein YlzI (FlbEa/FlbD family)
MGGGSKYIQNESWWNEVNDKFHELHKKIEFQAMEGIKKREEEQKQWKF